ncbi:hypothetical protein BJ170DRAFT_618409 [Xylariales sp. AK1849]|nr:hypothetical protein BJ170DRAFT_618409 [Xylariales sp. AK1849]
MVRFISDDRVVAPSTSVPLRVVAAGLPRAATSSMQAAVEQLGFGPCLHMGNIVPHASRTQVMINAIKEVDTAKRQKLIHQLIDGHASLCDMPVCFFMPDLMDMYPDVKVILNQRANGEVWSKSAWDSLGFLFTWRYWLIGRLFKTDRLWYQLNMVGEQWMKDKYDVDSIWTAASYDTHYQMVRDEAAKRNIEVLEFQPEQGWAPLCKYLGKEIPDMDFPRLNEKKAVTIIKAILVTRGLLAYLVFGGGLWASWRYSPSAFSYFKALSS